jgi:hypothetical protein
MERNTRAEMVVVLAVALCVNYGIFRWFVERSNAQQVVEMQSAPGCSADGCAGEQACDGFTQRSVRSTDRNAFGCPVTWTDHPMNDGYTMTVGMYQQWLVAFELSKNGVVLLRDYTPPGEYVTFVDPLHRNPLAPGAYSFVSNGYSRPLMAFTQRSIYDKNLSNYEQYEFGDHGPVPSAVALSE